MSTKKKEKRERKGKQKNRKERKTRKWKKWEKRVREKQYNLIQLKPVFHPTSAHYLDI